MKNSFGGVNHLPELRVADVYSWLQSIKCKTSTQLEPPDQAEPEDKRVSGMLRLTQRLQICRLCGLNSCDDRDARMKPYPNVCNGQLCGVVPAPFGYTRLPPLDLGSFVPPIDGT